MKRFQTFAGMEPEWTPEWQTYSRVFEFRPVWWLWKQTLCRLGVHLLDQIGASREPGSFLYCDGCACSFPLDAAAYRKMRLRKAADLIRRGDLEIVTPEELAKLRESGNLFDNTEEFLDYLDQLGGEGSDE